MKKLYVLTFLAVALFAVSIFDRGCMAQETGGVASVSSPNETGIATVDTSKPVLFFTRIQDGGIAPCDSCKRPMSAPIPELGDKDAFLTDVSMFPCFNCGDLHLIARLNYKKASGGSFATKEWLEWTWDRQVKGWKLRKDVALKGGK